MANHLLPWFGKYWHFVNLYYYIVLPSHFVQLPMDFDLRLWKENPIVPDPDEYISTKHRALLVVKSLLYWTAAYYGLKAGRRAFYSYENGDTNAMVRKIVSQQLLMIDRVLEKGPSIICSKIKEGILNFWRRSKPSRRNILPTVSLPRTNYLQMPNITIDIQFSKNRGNQPCICKLNICYHCKTNGEL